MISPGFLHGSCEEGQSRTIDLIYTHWLIFEGDFSTNGYYIPNYLRFLSYCMDSFDLIDR